MNDAKGQHDEGRPQAASDAAPPPSRLKRLLADRATMLRGHPPLILALLIIAGSMVGLAVVTWRATTSGMADPSHCLAMNIYHEARGEPREGRIAVSQVVMNRVADRGYPNDVCAVIRQGGGLFRFRCQFSWYCDGRSDRPADPDAWAKSQALAEQILAGQHADPTGGALWYHAEHVSPPWRNAYQAGPKIGRHQFYRRP
jgi:spore germination cell wall hydrolase CwlJ-like protein